LKKKQQQHTIDFETGRIVRQSYRIFGTKGNTRELIMQSSLVVLVYLSHATW